MLEERQRAAAESLGRLGSLAFLLVHPANVRYLSGFAGSNGWLLVRAATGARPLLITDSRYREQAAEEAPSCDVRIADRGLAAELAAGDLLEATVRFEEQHLSCAALRELREAAPHVEWLPATGVIEALRARKDAGEITAIRRALALAESVLATEAAAAQEGDQERQLAARLEYGCRAGGADRMAFETIVATGAHGALPHARPGERSLGSGEVAVVDLGCVVDGYCSDITRALCMGPVLAGPWEEVHGALSEALEAACEAIQPGIEGAAVDAVARGVLERHGLAEHFAHSLGHGVGLEVHEAPRLADRSKDVLAAGMVVTVEPGVYLPGRGGMRLEELILVTEGGAERLNELSVAPLRGGRPSE